MTTKKPPSDNWGRRPLRDAGFIAGMTLTGVAIGTLALRTTDLGWPIVPLMAVIGALIGALKVWADATSDVR